MTAAATSPPSIVSDSTMWQSRRWNEVVDSVYVRVPRRRVVNHPLLIALKLLWRRRRYEVVLTTGNRVSLYYGLLCRLLFLSQKQVVAQLYLDDRGRWGNLIHDSLMRWVLRGTYGVLVASRGEFPAVEGRFGVPQERIRFVAYHTTVTEPENLGTGGDYAFSGGRNFRDYETLIRAVDGTDVRVVIVCGANQLRDIAIPENVTVLREIPWEEYIRLLKGASFAVVPLSTEVVPSGQVAILEATAYGKPVITADSVGTVDYVNDGVDGMLYRAGDAADLRAKVLALASDDALRSRMGEATYDRTMAEFTFEQHVDSKVAAISDLAAKRAAAGR